MVIQPCIYYIRRFRGGTILQGVEDVGDTVLLFMGGEAESERGTVLQNKTTLSLVYEKTTSAKYNKNATIISAGANVCRLWCRHGTSGMPQCYIVSHSLHVPFFLMTGAPANVEAIL